MKEITFLLLILGTTLSSAQDYKKIADSLKQVVVQEHRLDLDKDGKLDKILLKEPPYGDPGQFNSYEIILSSGDRVFDQPYGLDFAQTIEFGFKNQVESNLIYIPEFKNKTYIFFFGFQYGCCLKQLICYEVRDHKILKVHSGELEVSAIGDFNNDGVLNIEGKTDKGEIWGSSAMNASFSRATFEKVLNIGDSLYLNPELTYKRHPTDYQKFGNYLDIQTPILVKMNDTEEEFLEPNQIVTTRYNRIYQIASLTKIRNSSLQEQSKKELRLMRNEIFAAHGYIFKSADLREYFEKTKWYKPRYSNVDDRLTEIEKYNIKQILKVEKSKSP